MPQDLMSATFLNRILKNRTEKTVQARLKRSIEGDVNPVKIVKIGKNLLSLLAFSIQLKKVKTG